MMIEQNGDSPAIFVIAVDRRIIFVAIHRADPFRLCPAGLEAEYSAMLTILRSLPASADIIREAWFYSKAGTLRFFRVEDSWLLEIGRDGSPLALGDGRAGDEPVR